DRLSDLYAEFLVKEGILKEEELPPKEYIRDVVIVFKERARTVKEMVEHSLFLYKEVESYDESGVEKFFNPDKIPYLESVLDELERIDELTPEKIEELFNNVIKRHNIKLKDIAQTVRLAITGRTVSPGLVEIILLTGKEKLVKRIKKAIDFIKSRGV
ncbi:MAG: glutamate--tRNA ligase, partial [Thermosulfidibacteraceae bacterium]